MPRAEISDACTMLSLKTDEEESRVSKIKVIADEV